MLTFYPTISRGELGKYMQSPCVLLVASSFAADEVRKYGKVRGKLPVPILPDFVTEKAADCGGFVATFKWGKYPYTPEQYVEWLYGWLPQWAATMDYCCEDEITGGKPGIVRERQQKTTEMAYHFWQDWKLVPWAWVPTIQGWTVEDYKRHAMELKPLIQEMKEHYTWASEVTFKKNYFRVGIGTLCRRASVEMIHEVIQAVSAILGDVPLHLWGVKLGLLQSPLALPEQVVSIDSAAWNGMFKTNRERWRQSGLKQREYCHAVALPAYLEKVERALSTLKQAAMF